MYQMLVFIITFIFPILHFYNKFSSYFILFFFSLSDELYNCFPTECVEVVLETIFISTCTLASSPFYSNSKMSCKLWGTALCIPKCHLLHQPLKDIQALMLCPLMSIFHTAARAVYSHLFFSQEFRT